jgi:hypothetical protein
VPFRPDSPPADPTAPAPAPAARAACPRCGRSSEPGDLACGLCGEVLARTERAAAVGASRSAALAVPAPVVASDGEARRAWTSLAIGAALAPLLTLTPVLRYVGWFLASLVHETGHTAVSWALGCPAVPAIRLDGHAAAVHQGQQVLLCVATLGALAALAWRARRDPPRLALWAVALAAYPLLAFTGARETLFLAGGHLGEVAFGGVFLALAARGGVTGGAAERVCHAAVGAYLLGRSAVFAGGLAASASARAAYAGNGSFGLENDLVRLSRGGLGPSIPTLGVVLLVLTVAAAALALFLGRRGAREAAA